MWFNDNNLHQDITWTISFTEYWKLTMLVMENDTDISNVKTRVWSKAHWEHPKALYCCLMDKDLRPVFGKGVHIIARWWHRERTYWTLWNQYHSKICLLKVISKKWNKWNFCINPLNISIEGFIQFFSFQLWCVFVVVVLLVVVVVYLFIYFGMTIFWTLC